MDDSDEDGPSALENLLRKLGKDRDPFKYLFSGEDFPEIKFNFAMGRFITSYTQVESTMLTIVEEVCRLEPVIARALFHNLRMDNAINYINRTLDALRSKGPRATELRLILQHLGAIQRVRNDLLHLGASQAVLGSSKKFVITNRDRAHVPGARRQMPISAADLMAMALDLDEIGMRFWRLFPAQWGWMRRPGSGKADEEFGKPIRKRLKIFDRLYPRNKQPAWRYKPQSQSSRRSKPVRIPAQQYLPQRPRGKRHPDDFSFLAL